MAVPTTAADLDGAIRTAAKVTIDAGDYRRARALLDLLDVKPAGAASVLLAAAKHVPK